jgi:2'-5' RNA ligase
MLLDIVILPPAKLRESIGEKIRQATKNMPAVFVVDNRKLIYHLSLFHIKLSERRLMKLEAVVGDIVKKYRSCNIRPLAFENYSPNEVWCRLSNNKILKNLNKEIVESCYTLRTGAMPWSGKKPPAGLDKKLRIKYGTQHNIGKRFVPHFTIAEFRDPEITDRLVTILKSINFSFLADTVAICEVNRQHQVVRVIKKFKLKK